MQSVKTRRADTINPTVVVPPAVPAPCLRAYPLTKWLFTLKDSFVTMFDDCCRLASCWFLLCPNGHRCATHLESRCLRDILWQTVGRSFAPRHILKRKCSFGVYLTVKKMCLSSNWQSHWPPFHFQNKHVPVCWKIAFQPFYSCWGFVLFLFFLCCSFAGICVVAALQNIWTTVSKSLVEKKRDGTTALDQEWQTNFHQEPHPFHFPLLIVVIQSKQYRFFVSVCSFLLC